MSGRIRVDNWAEVLQPLLVNQHPRGDDARRLEVLLMDIDATLKFSLKRTLERTIDFLTRVCDDYPFLEAALAHYKEAEEELKKSAASLNRFVQIVDWRDNELGLDLDPYTTLLTSAVEKDLHEIAASIGTGEANKLEYQITWEKLLRRLDDLFEEKPTMKAGPGSLH